MQDNMDKTDPTEEERVLLMIEIRELQTRIRETTLRNQSILAQLRQTESEKTSNAELEGSQEILNIEEFSQNTQNYTYDELIKHRDELKQSLEKVQNQRKALLKIGISPAAKRATLNSNPKLDIPRNHLSPTLTYTPLSSPDSKRKTGSAESLKALSNRKNNEKVEDQLERLTIKIAKLAHFEEEQEYEEVPVSRRLITDRCSVGSIEDPDDLLGEVDELKEKFESQQAIIEELTSKLAQAEEKLKEYQRKEFFKSPEQFTSPYENAHPENSARSHSGPGLINLISLDKDDNFDDALIFKTVTKLTNSYYQESPDSNLVKRALNLDFLSASAKKCPGTEEPKISQKDRNKYLSYINQLQEHIIYLTKNYREKIQKLEYEIAYKDAEILKLIQNRERKTMNEFPIEKLKELRLKKEASNTGDQAQKLKDHTKNLNQKMNNFLNIISERVEEKRALTKQISNSKSSNLPTPQNRRSPLSSINNFNTNTPKSLDISKILSESNKYQFQNSHQNIFPVHDIEKKLRALERMCGIGPEINYFTTPKQKINNKENITPEIDLKKIANEYKTPEKVADIIMKYNQLASTNEKITKELTTIKEKIIYYETELTSAQKALARYESREKEVQELCNTLKSESKRIAINKNLINLEWERLENKKNEIKEKEELLELNSKILMEKAYLLRELEG